MHPAWEFNGKGDEVNGDCALVSADLLYTLIHA
jgi:hypothetical protein